MRGRDVVEQRLRVGAQRVAQLPQVVGELRPLLEHLVRQFPRALDLAAGLLLGGVARFRREHLRDALNIAGLLARLLENSGGGTLGLLGTARRVRH